MSNIAATGIYDPFTHQYAAWAFSMFNIPMDMMPSIVDSAGDHFGSTKQGEKFKVKLYEIFIQTTIECRIV